MKVPLFLQRRLIIIIIILQSILLLKRKLLFGELHLQLRERGKAPKRAKRQRKSKQKMMASESSKGFDFASDDILCSYANQDQSNDSHFDSAIGTNSAKEFNKEEVIIMEVERSMKKHTDNVIKRC
ncbi:hypothetical protein L1987_83577 [Smallanthus sonchifolius]|uniref:Uncharacterized protein n=1 Tax=Smallanthus sonchifolius TaxID=185202 RepID=A0ACB8YCZ3_9ASTR|nr:hypothetical protein L1987_83577 [Smallanthus sonchifolius]